MAEQGIPVGGEAGEGQEEEGVGGGTSGGWCREIRPI